MEERYPGRSTRRRFLGSALAAGIVGLAGCSGSDGGAGTETTEPWTTTTARETTTRTGTRIEGTNRQLIDEPLGLALREFPPETEVTVDARFDDYSGRTWRSSVTVTTDAAGDAVLADRAPTAGTYDRADGMGLIWSARPDGEANWYTGTVDRAVETTLTASVDGEPVTKRTLTRNRWAGARTGRPVLPDDLAGYYSSPAGSGPHPGVLLLHGSGGYPMKAWANLLAARGYASLALRYFGDPDPVPDDFGRVPLSYFERALEWLGGRTEVDDGRLGVLGYSRGTEPATILSHRTDDVSATVLYMPSAYAWDGFEGPAWVTGDGAVPTLPYDGSGEEAGDVVRYRGVFEDSIAAATRDERESTALPVEGVDDAVLLISGEDDALWPSDEMGKTLADRLSASSDATVTHRSYEGAGHNVYFPYQPTTRTMASGDLALGGKPAAIARANADSWPRVLATLPATE